MRVSAPIAVSLPNYGVLFAESAHTSDFRMTERADNYHKLIYVLEGEVAYRENRVAASVEAEAGTVLIVPRGVSHHIVDERPTILLLLCLSEEFLRRDPDLDRLWETLTAVPRHRLRMSRPTRQRLEAMWQRAIVEKEHARVGGAVSVRALAAQTLVLLARLPAKGGGASSAERIAEVTREIEETFFDEWDLDRAAARASLSRRRFSDLFRQAQGCTFWEFLNAQRLEHAARLLRTGNHSVTGVAFSSGFNDLSHFYRLFRGRFKQAPRAWLAAVNQGSLPARQHPKR